MAAARLSAAVSVSIGLWLAVALPVSQGAGVVALIGWTGLVVLAVGLVLGFRGAVSVAAITFVLRSAAVGALGMNLVPPLWAQVPLVVLMVEFASASFTLRSRPADPFWILARGLGAALAAGAVAVVLQQLLEGAVATGTLVRIAGVAALVIGAGWVTWTWRRSGLTG